ASRVFFECIYGTPEPAKEPSPCEMALPETCADRMPPRPIRASISPAEPTKPGSQGGQRSLSPPRICTATPTTANRRAPSPAAPANRKPDAHRTAAAAGRGQTWAWSPPGPGRRDHRFSWLVAAIGATYPVVGVSQLVLGDVHASIVGREHQVLL